MPVRGFNNLSSKVSAISEDDDDLDFFDKPDIYKC
jgi:hypothetical protein